MVNTVRLVDENTGSVEVHFSGPIESIALFHFLKSKGDSNPKRVQGLIEAIKIGGHALNLETTSMLISEVEKNLEGRLSVLRQVYESRKKDLSNPSKVGTIAEGTFKDALERFSEELNFGDKIQDTSTNSKSGMVRGKADRKLGDIEIAVQGSDLTIAVESKYAKKITMGDPTLPTASSTFSIEGHAKGQVLGSQLNRGSTYVIFITKPDSEVAKKMGGALKLDHATGGIFVVADLETGQLDDLRLAYMLARSLTLSQSWPVIQQQHLRSVAALLVRSATKMSKYRESMEALAQSGRDIADTAESLAKDYEEENALIAEVLEYLKAVVESSESQNLELRILQIEKLTGQKFEAKTSD
jgi:hypothetical protein